MGVFADEANRPLIHPPGHRLPAGNRYEDASGSQSGAVRAGEAREVEPAAGRVTGLVTVRAEAPPEQQLPEPQTPAPSPPPARRRAPIAERANEAPEPAPATAPRLARVSSVRRPRPSLLKADDEHVGAPEQDSTPYASSAWLRMVETFRPPWANDPAAASFGSPMALPPIPEGGASWSSEAPAPPPRTTRAARTEAQIPERRASLAESRRLGLGKPRRRPPAQNPDPQETSVQEARAEGESAAGTPAEPAVPDAPAASDEVRDTPLEHPRVSAAASASVPEPAPILLPGR